MVDEMTPREQRIYEHFSKRNAGRIVSFLEQVLLPGIETLRREMGKDAPEEKAEYWLAYNDGMLHVARFIEETAEMIKEEEKP